MVGNGQPFDAVEVYWSTPLDIAAQSATTWNRIRVYRSTAENCGYQLITDPVSGIVISEFDSQVNGNWVTYWDDPTIRSCQKDSYYYLIRYYNQNAFQESKFYLTLKTPSPREQRLIGLVRQFVAPLISACMTDEDIRSGIILAMNAYNIYPPVTYFTLNDFPESAEPVLVLGTAIFMLMFKYLGVAMTDVSYSDSGLSLTIDRGLKIKTHTDTLLAYYNQMIPIVKFDYMFTGTGLGTVQLPFSLGGNLNRGLLNVLDIFTAVGR